MNKSKFNRYKIIVNKPAVILIDTATNKKYVSKCSPEDEFNPETGLMMCFTKLAGYNYHDLLELLSTAVNATATNNESTNRKCLYFIMKTSGRDRDCVLSDYDLDTYEFKFGEFGIVFESADAAQKIIDELDLKDVIILEETLFDF